MKKIINENKRLPSDIDYIDLFDDNTDTGEARFDGCVKTVWSITMKITEESRARQYLFRLQWLGDWLAETYGWKTLNPYITPLNAVHCYLILRDNLPATQVAGMTPEQMQLALAEEWDTFKARKGAKDFLRRVEKRQGFPDDPFRGVH